MWSEWEMLHTSYWMNLLLRWDRTAHTNLPHAHPAQCVHFQFISFHLFRYHVAGMPWSECFRTHKYDLYTAQRYFFLYEGSFKCFHVCMKVSKKCEDAHTRFSTNGLHPPTEIFSFFSFCAACHSICFCFYIHFPFNNPNLAEYAFLMTILICCAAFVANFPTHSHFIHLSLAFPFEFTLVEQ